MSDAAPSFIWQRWILLEAALLEAIATDDLLLAASALRTLLEELAWLHAIDLSPAELVLSATSPDEAGAKRVAEYMRAAWMMIGSFSREQILQGTGFPKPPLGGLSEHSRLLKSRLNGFVHPNYGSHVAALYPESGEAAQIVLEAIIAVYRDFERLRFSPTAPTAYAPSASANECRADLVERFLQTTTFKVMPAIEEISAALIDTETLSAALRRPPLVDDVAVFEEGGLLDSMPRSHDTDVLGGYALWAGGGIQELISLARARRAEGSLRTDYPSGAPGQERESEWLNFQIASLELAVATANAKRGALRVQLMRQMLLDNPLGTWLCARALIENHAVSIWLPQILNTVMDTLAVGECVADSAAKLERALAEFLTTNALQGDARPWALEGGQPRGRISLQSVVNLAFHEQEFWSHQYDMASAVLHGRTARSLDLVQDPERLRVGARVLGLLTLARLAQDELDLDVGSAMQWGRIRHVANVRPDEVPVAAQRWSWGWDGGPLMEGRDYEGSGTRDVPFVLRSHIFFYQGCRRLVADTLGEGALEPYDYDSLNGRKLDCGEDGALYDVWHFDGRQCWIKVPNQPEYDELPN